MFNQEKQSNRLLDAVQAVALRVVAAVFLYLTLEHWAYLIGFFGDGFLSLGSAERLYHLAMSVFAPVVAFGLWACAGWAVVLWGAISLSVLAISELGGFALQAGLHAFLVGALVLFIGFSVARKRLA